MRSLLLTELSFLCACSFFSEPPLVLTLLARRPGWTGISGSLLSMLKVRKQAGLLCHWLCCFAYAATPVMLMLLLQLLPPLQSLPLLAVAAAVVLPPSHCSCRLRCSRHHCHCRSWYHDYCGCRFCCRCHRIHCRSPLLLLASAAAGSVTAASLPLLPFISFLLPSWFLES